MAQVREMSKMEAALLDALLAIMPYAQSRAEDLEELAAQCPILPRLRADADKATAALEYAMQVSEHRYELSKMETRFKQIVEEAFSAR